MRPTRRVRSQVCLIFSVTPLPDSSICCTSRDEAHSRKSSVRDDHPANSARRGVFTRSQALPTVEGEVAKAVSFGIVLNAEIILASIANHGCDSSPVVAVSECRWKVAEGCRVIAVLGQESPRFSHLCLVEAIDVNDSAPANDDAGVLAVVDSRVRAPRGWEPDRR